jgi:hypothetical protein
MRDFASLPCLIVILSFDCQQTRLWSW